MLWKPENHQEFIVAPRGGDRVYNPGHALVSIIRFPRPCGEDPILKEERLVPGKNLLKEVSLPGLVLSTETILV